MGNRILMVAFVISLGLHGAGFISLRVKDIGTVSAGEAIEVGLLGARWSEPFLELPGYWEDEGDIFEPTEHLFLRKGVIGQFDLRKEKARVLELPGAKTDLSLVHSDNSEPIDGPFSPLEKKSRSQIAELPVIQGPVAKRRVLFQKYPDYPEWALNYGLEFEVRLKFWVLPTGEVSWVAIEDSSGYPEVDAEVIRVMRHWRFNWIEGQGDPQWGTILFEFRLRS